MYTGQWYVKSDGVVEVIWRLELQRLARNEDRDRVAHIYSSSPRGLQKGICRDWLPDKS